MTNVSHGYIPEGCEGLQIDGQNKDENKKTSVSAFLSFFFFYTQSHFAFYLQHFIKDVNPLTPGGSPLMSKIVWHYTE